MGKEALEDEVIQLDFKSLAPRTDVDLSVYKDAFLFALSNDGIKNVAITGSYGAGKSSVMESFKKTEVGQKYTYLHVSLAHFEQVDGKEDDKISEGELEHLLEGKIINQLMHKIPSEKISDSKVSLKKIPEKENVRNWTVGIVLGFLLVLYFVFFVGMAKMKTKHILLKGICAFLTKWYVFVPAVALAIFLLYKLITYLVTEQMKSRFFKRVCFKDAEIELFGDDKENDFSYFDRYLDEIKYLFRNSEVEVFVFEDIDRYGTNLIFEKLREINDIINADRENPIRFFYLLRDDLFVEKDRTKFFDFIIPILPVISKHNSFNIYLKYLENGAFPLRREFLKQISLYIDDMRILNNIYNEYQIYQMKLKGISVGKSAEKIFSLVTYKNLFPAEFICLQRGEGYVVSLFEEKGRQVGIKAREIDETIAWIEEQIKEKDRIANEEFLKDRKELDALFFKLDEVYRCNGKERNSYATTADFVADLIDNPEQVRYRSYSSWYDGADKIRLAITNMNKDPEYKKRKAELEQIEQFVASERKKLQDSITQKKEEKEKLRSLTFKEYAEQYDFEQLEKEVIRNAEEMKNQQVLNVSHSLYAKLIQFLLVNGYIDENYSDFIAVFQNDDISQRDKKYVRAVLDNEPLEYTYPILRPKVVSEYLDEKHLQTVAFFNRDMFAYFMLHGTEEKKELVTNAIKKHKEYDFVSVLLDDQRLPYASWIEYLIPICPDVVQYLVRQNGEVDKAHLLVAASLLCENTPLYNELSGDLEQLIRDCVCRNANLFDQVLKHDKVIVITQRENVVLNFVNNLKSLQWKLSYFEFDRANNKDFADAIYVNDLYEMNLRMITQILSVYYQIEIKENETHLYEKIVSTSEQGNGKRTPLHAYVNKNMDVYTDLLIDNNLQMKEIQEVSTLEQVNELIQHRCLRYDSTNIFRYYDLYNDTKVWCEENEEEFNEADLLVAYICDFPEDALSFSADEVSQYGNEKNDRMNSLMTKICRSNEIPDENYRSIAVSLNRIWRNGAPSDIPSGKLSILIDEKIIKMTKTILPSMREKYPKHMRQFILVNEDAYFKEVMSEDVFDISECLMLLKENISDERKIELLTYTSEEISVQNDKYSEELVLYILENNYSEDDFEYLIQRDYTNIDLQRHVIQLADERATEIVDEDFGISKAVCRYFLLPSTSCVSLSQKKLFMAEYMEYFTKTELKDIMGALEMNDFMPLFENKNPLIEDNSVNRKLLVKMQSAGVIGKYVESSKEEGYYRVYSKKNRM